jgi:hypothetical protein
MDRIVQARLEQARKELLDLGLRNSLLNYRARSNRIDVIDELSEQTFKILVSERKQMYFKALPGKAIESIDQELLSTLSETDQEWASIFSRDEDPEELASNGIAARHTDNKLQTRLAAESLHSRLLKIHRSARTFLEEQGVNTLYLALGFLHWFESDASNIVRKAPLILVPVELARTSARARFKLSYNEEELSTNLSLAEKLKEIIGIEIPTIEDDELNVPAYFDEVRRAISGQNRWTVADNEICLGFFSFGKFLMYKDLELDKWPENSTAHNNEIISALLGDGFVEPSDATGTDDEDRIVLEETSIHQVVDADSSQSAAIAAVQSGKNIVIQGPPGTGKSQTITNLIADCLANDKTVLFVAEKMAALEVVKRRLDQIDLGDAVLELHSHKTNKKALLKELHRTLELGKPKTKKAMVDLERLSSTQARLDEYAAAVNTPVNNSGFSPSYLIGTRKKLLDQGASSLDLNIESMSEWSWSEVQQKLALVRQFKAVLATVGVPDQHPFYSSGLTVILPADMVALSRQLSEVNNSLKRLQEYASELSRGLGLALPETVADVRLMIRAAKRAIDAPHLQGVRVNSAEWQVRRDDLRLLVDSGRRMSELTKARNTTLISEAWDADVLSMRQAFVNYSAKWWRFLSSDYRRAKNTLAGYCKDGLPGDKDEFLPLVDDILEFQRNAEKYSKLSVLGATLYGAQWQSEQSDWDVLDGLTKWIVALYDEIGEGKIPEGIILFLAGNPTLTNLSSLLQRVSATIPVHMSAIAKLVQLIAMESDVLDSLNFPQLASTLKQFTQQLPRLHEVTTYNNIVAELEEADLGNLVQKVKGVEPGRTDIELALHLEWIDVLLNEAYTNRIALQRFDKARHEEDIKEFRKLDSGQFFQNRALLARKHWDSIPSFTAGEVAIIRREILIGRGGTCRFGAS